MKFSFFVDGSSLLESGTTDFGLRIDIPLFYLSRKPPPFGGDGRLGIVIVHPTVSQAIYVFTPPLWQFLRMHRSYDISL